MQDSFEVKMGPVYQSNPGVAASSDAMLIENVRIWIENEEPWGQVDCEILTHKSRVGNPDLYKLVFNCQDKETLLRYEIGINAFIQGYEFHRQLCEQVIEKITEKDETGWTIWEGDSYEKRIFACFMDVLPEDFYGHEFDNNTNEWKVWTNGEYWATMGKHQ